MEIGGAERALLGLLNSIDKSKYDVDLFLARHEGEFMKFIPSHINLLITNQAKYLAKPMVNLLKEKKFEMLYGRLKAKYDAKKTIIKLKLKCDNQVELIYSHLYTLKYISNINIQTE